MTFKQAAQPAPPPDAVNTSFQSEHDQISKNIEAVLEFYTREDLKISPSQRMIERVSLFIGQPGRTATSSQAIPVLAVTGYLLPTSWPITPPATAPAAVPSRPPSSTEPATPPTPRSGA